MLKDLLKVDIKFSEYHVIFPRIILTILIILLAAIGLQNLIRRYKAGDRKKFQFTFFAENYDKLKFYGTILLLIGYVSFLEIIGFITSSIIFMFLLTILLKGNLKRKTLIVSVVNSVTTSVLVWFFFGYLFDITLP